MTLPGGSGKLTPLYYEAISCLIFAISDIFASVMAEKQFLEMRGEVLEALPGSSFRIKLENDMEVIGYLAGKLRKNRIRVMPGDDVKCEISPYDLTKARITFRF